MADEQRPVSGASGGNGGGGRGGPGGGGGDLPLRERGRSMEIREGAGLEESRLNEELIEALKKWSGPVMLVIAVLAGGYALRNYLRTQEREARDSAFVALDEAFASRDPVKLLTMARDHATGGAAPVLATLAAADLYLESYRTGVPVGVTMTAEGGLPEGQAFLTDEQRAEVLTKAGEQYDAARSAAGRESGQVLLLLGSMDGQAAVAESREQWDQARAIYGEIIAKARAAGLEQRANATQKKLETLGELKEMPRIYAQAELPVRAAAASSGLEEPEIRMGPGGPMMRVTPGPDGQLDVSKLMEQLQRQQGGQPAGQPVTPAPAGEVPGEAPKTEAPAATEPPTEVPPKP